MNDTRFISQLIKCFVVCTIFLSFNSLSAQSQDEATAIIEYKMKQQEFSWSAGDIEGFMDVYWKSDSLKFIGSKGLSYGWKTTLQNYQQSYPTKAAMGKLTFQNLHIELLGANYISVIGKWHLSREVGDLEGFYSLIWKNIDGEWVIISDHSS